MIYKLAGRQIRLLRNQHDITQKDFAEKNKFVSELSVRCGNRQEKTVFGLLHNHSKFL